MKALGIVRCIASACWIGLALQACGRSEPAVGVSQSQAAASHSERPKSWMLPEAKNDGLLYITDATFQGSVYVISYLQRQLVGTIEGLTQPLGECVDKNGAVWIVTPGPSRLIKYAHGATSPSATLFNADQESNGCATDPHSGDLAVASEDPADIAVFKNARGPAKHYADHPGIPGFFYCAYDDQGNLFGTSPNVTHQLAELPKGGKSLVAIAYPRDVALGSVDWDGQYLAINEIYGNQVSSLTVDRVQVNGRSATIASSVRLSGRKEDRNNHQTVEFWIHGNRIFGPAHAGGIGWNFVSVWRYPAGGRTVAHFPIQYGEYVYSVVFSPKPR